MLDTVGQVPNDSPGLSETASRNWHSGLVGVLIAIALLVRMYNGDAPFLTSYNFRSYDSAVYAQAIYLLGEPSTPECIRRVAQTNLKQALVMEPRVVERLAVIGYRFFGVCHWWPRFLLSLLWCLSAIALFALVAQMHSSSAAFLSIIFYLFSPCAIFTSRLFQPDSLMVSLMTISLYCLWNEFHRPTRLSFCLATATTALAMFVKIPCAFLLMPALAALAWNRYGLKRSMVNPRVWILALAVSLPSLWYYGMGLWVNRTLHYLVDIQWQPMMYRQAKFGLGWANMVAQTVGIPAVILGGMGLLFVHRQSARALIIGLWIGYIFYGLTFTAGISTHLYYQMPLIPILALTLGPSVLELVGRWMRFSRFFRYGAGILGLTVMAGFATIAVSPPDSAVKNALSPQIRGWMESGLNLCGANTPGIRLWGHGHTKTIQTAAHIGQLLHHSDRTVVLGNTMIPILNYYGLVSAHVWLDHKRVRMLEEGIVLPPIEEEFPRRFESVKPEYFIAWPEDRLQYQPDLAQYLERRYPVLERKDGYVIYDLRSVPDANSIR